MKVSVIIPFYKVAPYIERCATALMEQTLNGVEFIFVDDASPDESRAILENVLAKYPQRYPYGEQGTSGGQEYWHGRSKGRVHLPLRFG